MSKPRKANRREHMTEREAFRKVREILGSRAYDLLIVSADLAVLMQEECVRALETEPRYRKGKYETYCGKSNRSQYRKDKRLLSKLENLYRELRGVKHE